MAPRRTDRARSLPSRRTGLVVAWVLATLGGLVIAATTRIGPILVSITPTHGVHAGDVAGFVVCYAAVLLTTRLWPPRR